MKGIIVTSMLVLGAVAFGQEKTEVRKEVNMEEVNGEKKLTVKTTKNGNVTEEIYKGAAAEQKLAELDKEAAELQKNQEAKNKVVVEKNVEMREGQSSSARQDEVSKRVKMEKTEKGDVLTITTITNGEKKVEKYEGEAAHKKMKELEQENQQPESQPKKIEKKKAVIKSN